MGDVSIPTRLTREYGLRYPFVSAGMGFIAHERLAAAVANAGVLGVLGASPDPPDSLRVMVERLRALSDGRWGVDLINAFHRVRPGVHRRACGRVRGAGRAAGGVSP